MKRVLRWAGVLVLGILLLLASFAVLMEMPPVQNWVADRVAAFASDRLGADVRIGQISISPIRGLTLDQVYVGDLHGDTLLAVGSLRVRGVRIHPRARLLKISSMELRGGRFALATAVGDTHSNLTNLLPQLASSDTTAGGERWSVKCGRFLIDRFHFSFNDANVRVKEFGVDFKHIDIPDTRIAGSGLSIAGDSIHTYLKGVSLSERCGLRLEELSGTTTVSGRGIVINGLVLRTSMSDVRGELAMRSSTWSDFEEFETNVVMRLALDSSRLDFGDIAWFAPDLEGIHLPITLSGRIRGTISELKGQGMSIAFGQHSWFKGSAEMSGLPDMANTFMLLDIDELRTDEHDLENIPVPPFTSGDHLQLPDELKLLGAIRFSGNFTGFLRAFTAYGTSTSALGTLRTDLSYERDTVTNLFTIAGRAATESFQLGPLVGTSSIGPLAANIRLKASGKNLKTMKTDLEGQFPFFTINGTRITAIEAKGRLERNLFNGELRARDENLMLDFKGLADLRGRWPKVDFTANLQHADLKALGLTTVKGYNALSMQVKAQGRLSPDSLQGRLEVTDISYCQNSDEHDLGDLLLTSGRREGENVLHLDATFAEAEVVGSFLPTRLPEVLANVARSVFPSLSDAVNYTQEEQRFRFSVTTRATAEVLGLFVPGLSVDSGGTISGMVDSRVFDMGLEARLPHVHYGSFDVKDLDLIADKTLDVLAFSASSAKQTLQDSTWFAGTSVTGKAYQDELEFALGWEESSGGTNGNLDLTGEVRGMRSLDLDLLPSHLYFGRGEWLNTSTAHFKIDSSTVVIDSLVMLNDDQRIALNGTIARDPTASLAFDLRQVRLENLTPFLDGPVVKGSLDGDGQVFDLYGSPYVMSYLCADSVAVQDNLIGDLRFAASWLQGQGAMDLNGSLTRGPVKALDFGGRLDMAGGHNLKMDLIMDRFDLGFIEPYLPEGISEIQGQVTGTIAVTGALAEPQVNGEVDLVDAGLRIGYLNTLYRFTHRVKVAPDMFALDQVTIRDEDGNTSSIGGTILHNGLKDWNYNVWGTMDHMMVMNTTEDMNSMYFGKAYATGTIEVSGSAGSLEITVDARTAPGTDIKFPVGGSTEVSSIGFVHFVTNDTLEQDEEVDLTGVSLDLGVEVTPDARFELIFDPTVGDILSGRGQGNIEMSVTPAGEFAMRGEVNVSEGDYLFTLRNVVNKRFQINPGGRIVWFGDPFDAQLDIQAVYKLRAPLYDIMFEKNEAYRKRVPVEVVMNLRDKLLNPQIDFSVRLPSVDEGVRTQVNSVLSTEQEMNRQVFALIVLNRFVQPPAYAGTGSPTSSSNVAGTTTSELLSNQVSNWLSRLSNDFDLGFNYRPGDNLTQDELELAVSTQLFNERLLLSTNVGVQYGAQTTTNNNTLVGDFQVEYLMTNDGKLRLKAFSVSNDQNLNQADQAPTTQGVGVAYREEFDSATELWQKVLNIFRKSAKDRVFE
ncbi:MAG: translocation/assembly module TamB domain-containing protein [Flavobacteriales bacterium]